MAAVPTKPLFTTRFTLVNTHAYSQDQILNAFQSALKKSNYVIYQSPAVKAYLAKFTITTDKIDNGDGTFNYFDTMTIAGPAGKAIAVGRDRADPAGTRPILEQKRPMVTAVTWNIGAPAGVTPQQLSDLIWATRKATLYKDATYTGIGWTPVTDTWQNTPVKLSPYPDRPPMPAILEPVVVAPKPVTPKPIPVVVTPVPVVVGPGPTPEPVQATVIPWKWLGIGAAALLGFSMLSEDDAK